MFSCEFCAIFQKTLLAEHLRMTVPADIPFLTFFYLGTDGQRYLTLGAKTA